ncbi:hypothetical protein D3C73_999130 [compost metagenome]
MVVAQPVRPLRQDLNHFLAHRLARPHLDRMTLAVVEADRLHPIEPLQRPGQAGGAVLPAGKENKSCFFRMLRDCVHDKSAVGRQAARIQKRNRGRIDGTPPPIRQRRRLGKGGETEE